MEITTKVCTFLFYWKFNLNYKKIPCFVEMKSKQQNKISGFLQSTYNYFYFPKIMCLRIQSFPPYLPSLSSPKSHHHDPKPTRIQNSNLQCSLNNPYLKCFVHPNHVIILPL